MLSKRKRMFADYSIFNIIPRGLTARIAGFHPAGPGSTPGVGNTFFPLEVHFLFLQKSFIIRYLKFNHNLIIKVTQKQLCQSLHYLSQVAIRVLPFSNT